MDVKLALLTDQTFGIRQLKLQLWKELEIYQKCLYLESSTLVCIQCEAFKDLNNVLTGRRKNH